MTKNRIMLRFLPNQNQTKKSNNYTISGSCSQVKNLGNGTLQLLKNDWELIEFCFKNAV